MSRTGAGFRRVKVKLKGGCADIMAQTTVAGPESSLADTGQVVNDVVIKIATANGSGSQSANMILMRSIFDMGVPISGKNLFPSNIQGLPTWYTIRANEKGWVSQRRRTDIFIAMNPDTVTDDIAECDPGTTLIIRDTLKGLVRRDDLTVVAVPFDALVKKACDDTRLQKKVVNVVYVGIAAYLLDISLDCVHEAINRQFNKKPKAVELNNAAADAGYAWAEEVLSSQSNYVIRPCKKAAGKILIEGNQATALGLLFGGFHMAAWYPITPSTSVVEYLARYARKYRSDPETGKATYAIDVAVPSTILDFGERFRIEHFASFEWPGRRGKWVGHPRVHAEVQVGHQEHEGLELLGQIKGLHGELVAFLDVSWNEQHVAAIAVGQVVGFRDVALGVARG